MLVTQDPLGHRRPSRPANRQQSFFRTDWGAGTLAHWSRGIELPPRSKPECRI